MIGLTLATFLILSQCHTVLSAIRGGSSGKKAIHVQKNSSSVDNVVSAGNITSAEEKTLFWVSHHSSLFSQLLQTKLMYNYAQQYKRTLVLDCSLGTAIQLCDFFDFKSPNLRYGSVSEGTNCIDKLTISIMESSQNSICYNGPFLYSLNGAKSTREGLVTATALDLDYTIRSDKMLAFTDLYNDLLMSSNSKATLTVAHWQRGKCNVSSASVALCESADSFIHKVRHYSQDKIVYVVTNEPQDSKEMDAIRKAAGFKTLSNVVSTSSGSGDGSYGTAAALQRQRRYSALDSLSVLAVEYSLMLRSDTFLSWGVSEIDDVVEYERMKLGKSHCSAYEPYTPVNNNVTFCFSLKNPNSFRIQHTVKSNVTADGEVGSPTSKTQAIIEGGQSSTSSKDTAAAAAAIARKSTKMASLVQQPRREGVVLTKTAFSSQSRLLFVAGLEGTGHHAIRAMFSVCNKSSLCEPDHAIAKACQQYNSQTKTLMGLFSAGVGQDEMKLVATIEERMKILATKEGSHLFLVGLGFTPGSGMMSYPNYDGKYKTLDTPDVATLAQIAEGVGLDFRVLVLQRNADEIMLSTINRGFGSVFGYRGEPKILIESANALYSQLSMLDKRFFQCIQYKQLGRLSEKEKAKMVDFIHPTNLKEIIDSMLNELKYNSDNGSSSSKPSNKTENIERMDPLNVKYETMLLANRLALIDGLCH